MKLLKCLCLLYIICIVSCSSLPKAQNEGMQLLNYYFLNYYSFLSNNARSNHIRINSNRKTLDGAVLSQEMYFDSKHRISRIDWYFNSIKKDSTMYKYKDYEIEKSTSGESALRAVYDISIKDMMNFTMTDNTGFNIYGFYKRKTKNSFEFVMLDKKTEKELMKNEYIFNEDKQLLQIIEYNVYEAQKIMSEHHFIYNNNKIQKIENINRDNKNDIIKFIYNDAGYITNIAYSLNNGSIIYGEEILYL
jgi:hypothetical protein